MVPFESGDMVGRRVAVGEHLGTVRYAGPIPTAQGTWLGVEWDDPQRGKHNGTYNGHSYFKTRHPTSGSFIHIEKAEFGRSFVSAIKERYGSDQLTLTVEELQDLQRAMNAPHLEMVGFDKISEKQSCFSNLAVIGVHNCQVCSAGEDLASLSLQAKDLDLSLNLLTSWTEVAKIVGHMARVQVLNLSSNKLIVPESPESLRDTFRNLTLLVLGHMDYTWEQVITCSKMWPEIQQLQVPFNNITSLNLPQNTLSRLTHLDLEGNAIPDWEDINKLGRLDKLESLNLCALGLTNIKLPPSEIVFKNLQCLLLSDNKIEKWEYVSQLGKMPKLKELRFSNNPVLENLNVEVIHSKIVSRIESLQVLNRKTVTMEERKGAEIEYLKEHKNQWILSLTCEAINNQFLMHHPRFPQLVNNYGLKEEEVESVNTCKNSDKVTVKLSGPTKTVVRTLSKETTILKLTTLMRKLFKFGPTDPAIYVRSGRNPEVTDEMSSVFQTLEYYSVEDGDEIFYVQKKQ